MKETKQKITFLLQAQYLTADAAKVGLEAEQHVLHPLQDAITGADLVVQLGNVASLADVVLYGHLLPVHQLLLNLFGVIPKVLATLQNILDNVIL